MRISEEGIKFIQKWEGCELRAYKCPAGVWTIGYGHTKTAREGQVIDLDRASELLRADLEHFEQGVSRVVRVDLNQGQFDALVSFSFNLGVGALNRSTLKKKLNNGDYEGAAKEFQKWVKAGGRTLKGLVRRRREEARMFRGY